MLKILDFTLFNIVMSVGTGFFDIKTH